MLRAFLNNVKKTSILSQTEAVEAVQSKLGSEWSVSDSGLEKTYEFATYEHANNFLSRYNSYCEKVNSSPQWSNVYNTVSVALKCGKVGEITHKEVSIAQYLDMVHDVSMSMTEMVESDTRRHPAVLLTMDAARNDQYKTTQVEEKDYLKLAA